MKKEEVLKSTQLSGSRIWDKIFKNGPGKIYGRQPLKYFNGYALLKPNIYLQIFAGCLPQILLCPFLNIFSEIFLLHKVNKSRYKPYRGKLTLFHRAKSIEETIEKRKMLNTLYQCKPVSSERLPELHGLLDVKTSVIDV